MARLGAMNAKFDTRAALNAVQDARSFPWLRILMPSVLLLLGAYAVKVVWEKLHDPLAFPIKEVSVAGNFVYLDKNDVISTVSRETYKGFFGVDLDDLSKQLGQIPWVKEASLRRVWPDSLVVEIIEREAFAYWGEKGLVSVEGVAFFPNMSHVPANLPQFSGPLPNAEEMTQMYRKFSAQVQSRQLQIATLNLDDRHAWELVFNNGLRVKIGREKGLDRIERFMDVYGKVVGERAAEIDYVDLRYPNGFTVQWKSTVESAVGQQSKLQGARK